MINLLRGDITEVEADVIVNGANSHLVPGGEVSSAIHRCGGPDVDTACMEWVHDHGPVRPGSAAITTAGNLPALYIVHAVGPVWTGGHGDEADLLAQAYRASIALADAKGARSIAFPSISTGAFLYPVEKAAPVAIRAIFDALKTTRSVHEVKLLLLDQETFNAYSVALQMMGKED